MQVRMPTFEITEQDRRAIRFITDGRKTMCTREEAKAWIKQGFDARLRDLRYRWAGPAQDEAVANGADPAGLASVAAPTSAPAPAAPEPTSASA